MKAGEENPGQGKHSENAELKAESILRSRRRDLRMTVLGLLSSLRNSNGGFGDYDPVLTNGFAALALKEIGRLDRWTVAAQLQVLLSWERGSGVETPFHSTTKNAPAESAEEIARQLYSAGSAMVEGEVHDVSLYEDPHRLEGAPENVL